MYFLSALWKISKKKYNKQSLQNYKKQAYDLLVYKSQINDVLKLHFFKILFCFHSSFFTEFYAFDKLWILSLNYYIRMSLHLILLLSSHLGT